MKKTIRTIAAVALLGTSLAIPSLPAQACAQGTSSNYLLLGDFPSESQIGRRFYYAGEGGAASFQIHRNSDDCSIPATGARTSYTVDDGSATAGEDFEPTEGQTQDLYDPQHGQEEGSWKQTIPVPLIDDGNTEEPVEAATVRLFDPVNAVLIDPKQAPLHIIDNDGASRFSFGDMNYSHSESNTTARLPVFRAGDVSSSSSVEFSLSPGEENPATESKDYEVPETFTIPFPAGDRAQVIAFKVINDALGEGPEQISIELTGPDASGITQTTLTIIDNEESIRPRSRLHHPRQGLTYEFDDYRIREVHVFTSDDGGSGVIRAHIALRKKKTGGACAWWDGNGFTRGNCKTKRWNRMKALEPGSFYLYRFPAFKPSKGTNVRNYKAFSRAKDGAGNLETRFKKGRNANAFEIARR